MAALRFLTTIPTTQPTCGQLTVENPKPQCHNNSSESMGCFVQPSGLYCAPLSTTRGFLYTTDDDPTTNNTGSTGTNVAPQIKLSTTNPKNFSNSSLDISGLPPLTKGPSLLGQTCVGIPMSPQTSPIWLFLIEIANKRLNEKEVSPGLGSGSEVLSHQSDCEPNSYCDFSQSQSQDPLVRLGTCKEQLPNYHTCNSYIECISLRCDTEGPASNETRRKRSMNYVVEKRRVGAVCLPRESTLSNEGSSSGESGGNSFPTWAIALIVIAAVGAILLVILLVWRRKRNQKAKPTSERMRERERERSMSSNSFQYQPSSITTRVNSTSDSDRSKFMLPKITTTFSGTTQGSSSPTQSSRPSLSNSYSTSTLSAPPSPSMLSIHHYSAPPSPSSKSRSHRSSYNSSSFSGNDRLQDVETPSDLLQVNNDSSIPSLKNLPVQYATRTNSGNSSLPPLPSPTSPTAPVSPISPVSISYSIGTSRSSNRNNNQSGGTSRKI